MNARKKGPLSAAGLSMGKTVWQVSVAEEQNEELLVHAVENTFIVP